MRDALYFFLLSPYRGRGWVRGSWLSESNAR
jgi:hypothetical protein